jgi:ABC-type proline/glycine betaine transport system permease subunit
MVTVPPATAVARPLLSILATNVLDELQTTRPFISWLVPSEYSPKAVNCWVNPTWILGLTGVTNTEDRVAEVTVRVVLLEIAPEVAVMVAVAGAMAVARPLLSTVATDVLDELQTTRPFISWLVPSEYTPEATN